MLWQHGTTTGWTHAGDWVVAGTGLSMGTGRGGGVWSNFGPSRRRLGNRKGMVVLRAVSPGGLAGLGWFSHICCALCRLICWQGLEDWMSRWTGTGKAAHCGNLDDPSG